MLYQLSKCKEHFLQYLSNDEYPNDLNHCTIHISQYGEFNLGSKLTNKIKL